VAPGGYRLGLLPPGPDPIHRPPPHRTQSSTPACPAVLLTADPRKGIQPRYSGLRVQGTASSPSSTTGAIVTEAPAFVKAQRRSRPRYFSLPPACSAQSPKADASRVNSIGKMNFVAGPAPNVFRASRYWSTIVLLSTDLAASKILLRAME
jgi:hypothetical protein